MVNVICTTNIDCCRKLEWPNALPQVPRVGELIRSRSSTNNKHIELEVVRVTWFFHEHYKEWYADVELWMIRSRYASFTEFEKWVEGRSN